MNANVQEVLRLIRAQQAEEDKGIGSVSFVQQDQGTGKRPAPVGRGGGGDEPWLVFGWCLVCVRFALASFRLAGF